MGRRSTKEGINKGPWTAIEDKILTDYIKTHGEGKWGNIPRKSELNRCGKSCRLRWLNYVRPDIKRGNISQDEEDLILRLHKLLGNRWSLIAGRLPGRTDNEIKNYWNTYLSRKANVQGNKRQPKNTKTQQKSKTTSPASGLTSNSTDALFSTPHKRQQQQQQKQQQQQQHPDQPHAINDMDFSQPFPDINWVVGCAAEKSQSGDHRSESILIAKEDGNSSEFVTTDLSFGDISLSDFLDSDLAKLSGLDSYNMNMIDIMRGLEGDATTSTAAVIGGQKSDLLPLSSPDQAFLTAEWSGSTGPSGVRPNVLDSDFESLVSVMSANTCPDFWYFC